MSTLIKTLLPLLLSTALAASAQTSDWTINAKSGDKFVLYPASLRIYTNTLKVRQADMLIEFVPADGRNAVRHRRAVTGCGTTDGLTSDVDPNGNPTGKPDEWMLGGPRVYDAVAERICAAALARPARSSQPI